MKKKARLVELQINELSGVDKPCVTPATVAIMKRATGDNDGDDDDADADGGKPDQVRCAKCSQYMGKSLMECPACGGPPMKAKAALDKSVLSSADKDDLPDSAFLYVEPGGTKADGKTTPASLRHFPYKTADGKIDIVHLRAACSDIPKSSLPASVRSKVQAKAEKLLGAQRDIDKSTHPTTALQGDDMADAELQKKLDAEVAKTAALVALPGAHLDFYKKLDDAAKDAFLAKSAAQRDADVAKAAAEAASADPIVYQSDDGTEIRKSAGELAIKMAKQLDESTRANKQLTERLASADKIAKAERLTTIAKTQFSLCGKTEHVVKKLEWIDSLPEAEKTEQTTMLKQQQAAMVEAGRFAGVNPDADAGSGDPVVKFETELAAFAKKEKTTVAKAFVAFIDTEEGAELYRATKSNPLPVS